jgi:hypothetical protein
MQTTEVMLIDLSGSVAKILMMTERLGYEPNIINWQPAAGSVHAAYACSL